MKIIHRCLTCNHPDFEHTARECCYGWCRYSSHHMSADPELIPTFDLNGRCVAAVRPPDCDCASCRDLYEQATDAMRIRSGA